MNSTSNRSPREPSQRSPRKAIPPRRFRAEVEEIADVVVPRRLRPEDPGRSGDTRVLRVKVAFREPCTLKLGQRVEIAIGDAAAKEVPQNTSEATPWNAKNEPRALLKLAFHASDARASVSVLVFAGAPGSSMALSPHPAAGVIQAWSSAWWVSSSASGSPIASRSFAFRDHAAHGRAMVRLLTWTPELVADATRSRTE